MSNFETQIKRIANKSELKSRIDAMHDDAKMLLIIQEPSEGDYRAAYDFESYGDITCGDALWMVEQIKGVILQADADDEEEYE